MIVYGGFDWQHMGTLLIVLSCRAVDFTFMGSENYAKKKRFIMYYSESLLPEMQVSSLTGHIG